MQGAVGGVAGVKVAKIVEPLLETILVAIGVQCDGGRVGFGVEELMCLVEAGQHPSIVALFQRFLEDRPGIFEVQVDQRIVP